MKVSVVIPVYNAERFLRFPLDSVLAQTHSDWECICVDDGSTDGSGAILDEYAAKDARFRVVHKANGGEGSARNAGLDLATGELVAFLDADDAWHPESLRLFSAARERTGADVIRYGWRYVGSHSEAFEPLPPEKVRIEQVDFTLRRESTIRFCALGAATVVARSACGDIRFSPLTQGADLVYVLDCLLRSRKVAYVDAPLLHYLTHPGQISRRISKGLILGSCGYLPEVVARCAKLGECAAAWADTRQYVSDLVFSRLFGSWRLFDKAEDREEVRQSFWNMLGRLAATPRFFATCRHMAVRLSCRCESSVLLRCLVAWPYRLSRKFRRIRAALKCHWRL